MLLLEYFRKKFRFLISTYIMNYINIKLYEIFNSLKLIFTLYNFNN